MFLKSLQILTIPCILFTFVNGTAAASEETIHIYEKKIKTGLVYNLLKFGIWPSEKQTSETHIANLCLFGQDDEDILSPLEGKIAQKNTIAITNVATPDQARACQLLYFGKDKENDLGSFLPYIKGYPVLTVSDINNFLDKGGMIEFARQEEEVTFRLDQTRIAAVGIELPQRLLKNSVPPRQYE